MFNDTKLEVSETFERKWMVGKDPERANDVVGDLAILNAVVFEQHLEQLEALSVDEVLCQFICLYHVHQTVSERNL